MIWFLWALLGTFFSSLDSIIDKKIVVRREKEIDALVGSFYRNLMFWVFIILIGLSGIFGKIVPMFAFPLLIFAVLHVGSSLVYDHFLKNSEVIRFTSIGFIFPFILIVGDRFIFDITYTLQDFIGIFLLVLGGYVMAYNFIDGKSAFSLKQWGFFIFAFLVGIFEYVLFKIYHNSVGINEVSFYFSAWIYVMIAFSIFILIKGKLKIMPSTAMKDGYIYKTSVSKFSDALGGIFLLKAVSLSTITKVHSIEAFAPLIVFILALIMYKQFKWDLKESFDKKNLTMKFLAVIMLSIGGYLII